MQSVRFRSLLCLGLLGVISLSGCSNLSVAVGPKITQADLRNGSPRDAVGGPPPRAMTGWID